VRVADWLLVSALAWGVATYLKLGADEDGWPHCAFLPKLGPSHIR
jgi:hypothetical protein